MKITPARRRCPKCKRRLVTNVTNWHLALAGEPTLAQTEDPANPGRVVKFTLEQKIAFLVPNCRRCHPHVMYCARVSTP